MLSLQSAERSRSGNTGTEVWLEMMCVPADTSGAMKGLFGIAVQNGLVLVTQTRSLLTEGRPVRVAIREASIGRVRPKIMTAATAILDLLPILLLRLHGTEIERPLAIVMVAGLITSTLFTLLALPRFYLLVHEWRDRWESRDVPREPVTP
jgi:cobalt-zinc-cadmium resistance protein CzcA